MFDQVKKKDEDNREQKDGQRDSCVGPEVEAGEVEGGHYGERLHLAEAHPWQGHQCQNVVGKYEDEGGQQEQLHSCLAQGWHKTDYPKCTLSLVQKEKVAEEVMTSIEL